MGTEEAGRTTSTPSTPPTSSHVWTTDEHAADAYFHVCDAPVYVSFKDVIGGAALYRDGSGRPLEAAISDPLLRMALWLYVRE